MKGLPFAMTHGTLFAQFVRDSSQGPRRFSPCSHCGARMVVEADRAEQTVRCQFCARWQRVKEHEEVPWRLTPASAEALRRTRSWLRRL